LLEELDEGPGACIDVEEVSSCCSERMAWKVPFQRRSKSALSPLVQQAEEFPRPFLLRRFLFRPFVGWVSIFVWKTVDLKKNRLAVGRRFISHLRCLEDLDFCRQRLIK